MKPAQAVTRTNLDAQDHDTVIRVSARPAVTSSWSRGSSVVLDHTAFFAKYPLSSEVNAGFGASPTLLQSVMNGVGGNSRSQILGYQAPFVNLVSLGTSRPPIDKLFWSPPTVGDQLNVIGIRPRSSAMDGEFSLLGANAGSVSRQEAPLDETVMVWGDVTRDTQPGAPTATDIYGPFRKMAAHAAEHRSFSTMIENPDAVGFVMYDSRGQASGIQNAYWALDRTHDVVRTSTGTFRRKLRSFNAIPSLGIDSDSAIYVPVLLNSELLDAWVIQHAPALADAGLGHLGQILIQIAMVTLAEVPELAAHVVAGSSVDDISKVYRNYIGKLLSCEYLLHSNGFNCEDGIRRVVPLDTMGPAISKMLFGYGVFLRGINRELFAHLLPDSSHRGAHVTVSRSSGGRAVLDPLLLGVQGELVPIGGKRSVLRRVTDTVTAEARVKKTDFYPTESIVLDPNHPDVTLMIGGVHSIVGESGAGKTTAAQLMAQAVARIGHMVKAIGRDVIVVVARHEEPNDPSADPVQASQEYGLETHVWHADMIHPAYLGLLQDTLTVAHPDKHVLLVIESASALLRSNYGDGESSGSARGGVSSAARAGFVELSWLTHPNVTTLALFNVPRPVDEYWTLIHGVQSVSFHLKGSGHTPRGISVDNYRNRYTRVFKRQNVMLHTDKATPALMSTTSSPLLSLPDTRSNFASTVSATVNQDVLAWMSSDDY